MEQLKVLMLNGKVPSPIAMIGLSAVLGILLWSI